MTSVVTAVRGRVAVNPVLRRELVERMRGWRACLLLTAYLALLAGSLYLAYRAGRNDATRPFDQSIDQVAGVGRGIFEWLLFLMFMLVLFLVPAQTAGLIAGERERQTLVPLQVTLLRPRSIVLGKIGAAMAFLVLLIVASMPLLAVCYLIGGMSVTEVLAGVSLVLVLGLVLACICTAISSFTRRVQAATVLSYGAVLLLLFGTLMVRQAANAYDSSRGTDPANAPSWLLLPNPLATVADVVDDGADFGNTLRSPFDLMEETLRHDEGDRQSGDMVAVEGGQTIAVAPDAGVVRVVPADIDPTLIDEFGDLDGGGGEESPFWWQSLLLLGLVAALAVTAGAWRLRTPSRSER